MPLLTSLLTGIELPFLHRVTRHIPDDGLSDIPRSVRAEEISAEGASIFKHDPKGKVADAYRVLTKEVLNNAEKRRKHRLEGVR